MSFEEHIISNDKYPRIFLRQMEAIVFITLQIFFRNGRSFANCRISFQYSPVIAGAYSVT